ncbi:MAG: hypothetical protein AB7V16_13565 [Vulcanibacillus sp.]
MNWQYIREQFPERWVLIEALSTSSKNKKRNIEEMSVISDFKETKDAWQAFKKHNLDNPYGEYYIFHTSNVEIEVIEQPFIGIRGLQ